MERTTMTRPEATAVARAARTFIKQARWADEMRANGWTVLEPGIRDELSALISTTDPRAVAEALREAGKGECGAHEMEQIAALLDR